MICTMPNVTYYLHYLQHSGTIYNLAHYLHCLQHGPFSVLFTTWPIISTCPTWHIICIIYSMSHYQHLSNMTHYLHNVQYFKLSLLLHGPLSAQWITYMAHYLYYLQHGPFSALFTTWPIISTCKTWPINCSMSNMAHYRH